MKGEHKKKKKKKKKKQLYRQKSVFDIKLRSFGIFTKLFCPANIQFSV